MGMIIFLIAVIYVFYVAIFRRSYYGLKFKKDKEGIKFTSILTNEELMGLLREKLQYPDLKEINYDENGNVELICKYGRHKLEIKGERIYVSREKSIGTPSFKQMRNMEEAECLKTYLLKIYDPSCAINPYDQYKKLKNFDRHKWGLAILVLIACVYGVYSGMMKNGLIESMKSEGVSSGYLSNYSSDATVGETFRGFFENSSWTNYKQGAQKYVDFKGTFNYQGDDNAEMIITFLMIGDNLEVDEITINGKEISELTYGMVLDSIYSQSIAGIEMTTPNSSIDSNSAVAENDLKQDTKNTIVNVPDNNSLTNQEIQINWEGQYVSGSAEDYKGLYIFLADEKQFGFSIGSDYYDYRDLYAQIQESKNTAIYQDNERTITLIYNDDGSIELIEEAINGYEAIGCTGIYIIENGNE